MPLWRPWSTDKSCLAMNRCATRWLGSSTPRTPVVWACAVFLDNRPIVDAWGDLAEDSLLHTWSAVNLSLATQSGQESGPVRTPFPVEGKEDGLRSSGSRGPSEHEGAFSSPSPGSVTCLLPRCQRRRPMLNRLRSSPCHSRLTASISEPWMTEGLFALSVSRLRR